LGSGASVSVALVNHRPFIRTNSLFIRRFRANAFVRFASTHGQIKNEKKRNFRTLDMPCGKEGSEKARTVEHGALKRTT
jgi:hypothetical protein